ncbi:outer membrane beta-barrel protein [Flagellimonas baculiformis]|uniref:outer membrane beta-barrel protein n=1 Tax=Flagellimonas baculiformis TaxID=3067310 RepID=UPI00296F0A0F|nr:outer membrane beta-barrel protein [Muricauda sp. D6]
MLKNLTMGKKNLEQLFRDTFRDYHETPDEKVWRAIEASLDKKKQKKRIVPIWWQLGGVAAALVVLLYVIDPFGADVKQDVEQTITDTENGADPTTDKKTNPEDFNKPSSVAATEKLADSDKNDIPKTQSNPNSDSGDFRTTSEGHVAQTDKKTTPNEQITTPNIQNPGEKETMAVADNVQERNNIEQDKVSRKDTPLDNTSNNRDAIALNKTQNQSLEKRSGSDNVNAKKEEQAIALNEEQKKQKEESGKKSIYDAIKEQEAEEELIAAQDNSGKWSVGPSVAPVYFGAAGDGSPIHSDFSSNSKSGNFNLSYGLTVAYEVGKKVKIRSGVHKVNYGYDTNDVVFSSALRSSSNEMFANIDYRQNAEILVVQSANKSYSSPITSDAKEVLNATAAFDGKMVQQLGYIEVPVEVNYALVDKKFGVDLIGGVSSLFLVDNSVLLESQDLVTEVGEANNANSVNFSANVGMGLNYEFSPKVQLNIEPVFKYQLNTFSNTAGVFQPFSIGVYSGVSFKF